MEEAIVHEHTPRWIILCSIALTYITLTKIVGVLPSASAVVMSIACFVITVSFLIRSRVTVSWKYVVYFLYLFFNIILTRPDPKFGSGYRLILFIVVLSVISPVFQSPGFRQLRKKLLTFVLFACVLVSVLSFFSYFLGINYMQNHDSEYYSDYIGSAGHFGGITIHSMLLGPISGLSSILMLALFFSRRKIIFILLAALSMASLLMSASRGALIATLFGLVLVSMMLVKGKKQLIRYALVGAIILAVSFPLWSPLLDGLRDKQDSRLELGGKYDSRTMLFSARIDEIKNHPILGVGFCAAYDEQTEFIETNSTIEPGSSWLCIASMTGLIGLFFVLGYWRKSISFLRANYFDAESKAVLSGILLLFSIHMIIEGYFLAANSPLFYMIWLTLGVILDSESLKSCEGREAISIFQ